jgi:hypothetical protein
MGRREEGREGAKVFVKCAALGVLEKVFRMLHVFVDSPKIAGNLFVEWISSMKTFFPALPS